MNYLVTFANKAFRYNQLDNTRSAKKTKSFHRIFSFSPKDFEIDFYKQNAAILSQARGCGYWLWKPYFILKVLNRTFDDDIVFYCDSGSLFIDNVEALCRLPEKFGQDIIPFGLARIEKVYSKRDAFILMNCDEPRFSDTPHRQASFIVLRNTAFSKNFVQEWLNYAQDPRILTDADNVEGKSNYPEFIEHRHDQSIYSLLTKKYNLQPFRDPSQWGNPLMGDYVNSEYGQIINHTRHMDDPRLLLRIKRKLGRTLLKLTRSRVKRDVR
jgi:hypothetical protein